MGIKYKYKENRGLMWLVRGDMAVVCRDSMMMCRGQMLLSSLAGVQAFLALESVNRSLARLHKGAHSPLQARGVIAHRSFG